MLVGSDLVDATEVWLVRPGRHDKFVTLSKGPTTTNDSDGWAEPLSPSTWWCSMEPLDPSVNGDGTRILAYRVTGRYHAGITVDAVIAYGDRQIVVKGVQNVGEQNRELVLYCEEAVA